MSWFDTTKGLAGLAKTALKEAQKQIDKALDITEENSTATAVAAVAGVASEDRLKASKKLALPGGPSRAKSVTEPNTPSVEQQVIGTCADSGSQHSERSSSALGLTASTWGSFTGSFFENPKAHEMVTTPPTKAETVGGGSGGIHPEPVFTPPIGKRQSVTSNSDSVELLSSPVSPTSEMTSSSVEPAAMTASTEGITSPSVELLLSATPTNELGETSSSSAGGGCDGSLPESIVIITSHDDVAENEDAIGGNEEEEDSLSYNTVMDDTLTPGSSMVGTAGGATQAAGESSMIMISKQHSTASEDSTDNSLTRQPAATAALMLSATSTLSSSIGNKMLISLEDTQTINSDSTQSFECIQMQTSGMVEGKDGSQKDEVVAKSSPLSYSSPPHSNDEIETTTSSDIEIISNPNGDSSSTNSLTRTSPSQLKKSQNAGGKDRELALKHQYQVQAASESSAMATSGKKIGHQREPSEISILSEDSQSEAEKLLSRISELNEILEAREIRLLQSEQQNALLQERNHELQASLEAFKGSASNMDSAEEYTQRLSSLEKKFQASIRERDAMRIQIKALKDELQNKIPKAEMEQVVAENNQMIQELSQEGEKLSKEILQQSTIIKKLRAKEKASDTTLKKNKEEISSLSDELDRLKKTLNAKDEVERSQIEAVHKMSSEKRRLEEENAQLKSKLEDTQSRLDTVQASFEAVKTELHERNRLHSDLSRTAEEAQAARKEKAQQQAENKEVLRQLAELREKLRQTEAEKVKRENVLREENRELQRRLEEAELRFESSTQEISLTTIPLMRQLESLQQTLTQRTQNWAKEEKMLLEKWELSQSRLQSLESVESKYQEKVNHLQQHIAELEEKLSKMMVQVDQSELLLRQEQLDHQLALSSLNTQVKTLSSELEANRQQLRAKEHEVEVLQEENLRKQEDLSSQYHARFETAAEQQHQQRDQCTSPTNSLGRNSYEAGGTGPGGLFWNDDFDCISQSGRFDINPPGISGGAGSATLGPGFQFNILGNNTTTVEHLQALLKQRDGEVAHLQWELSRLNAERAVMQQEIANLTNEMENIKEELLSLTELQESHSDLQHRYDALLQMFGEKTERCEELELDIKELKEAYKAQIDELLAQPMQSGGGSLSKGAKTAHQ